MYLYFRTFYSKVYISEFTYFFQFEKLGIWKINSRIRMILNVMNRLEKKVK